MSGQVMNKMPFLYDNNMSSLLNNQPYNVDLTQKYFSGFVGVKWVAMMYVSIIQVVIGIVLSKMINKMVPPIKRKTETIDEVTKEIADESMKELLFYSFINLSLLVFANYLMRNIVERIPFPLEGVFGYRHDKLKERYGMIISGFILMYYQDAFRERITLIFKNVF
jgi:hypothetical protein